MGQVLSRRNFVVEDRTVLLLGASTGLGLEAARQLAQKGASKIIIVARNEARLQSAVQYISQGLLASSTQTVHSISADLHTSEECIRVVRETCALNNGLPPDIVWCCQGSAHPALFIDTPVEKFQEMMDQNYFSSVYIAHAVLNRWLRPSESGESNQTSNNPKAPLTRHLIFTSSFVSFLTFSGYSSYAPSKIALRSLCESLSQEVNLYAGAHPSLPPVRIHTVYPATILSPGLETENTIKSDLGKMLEGADEGESPAECAAQSIKGLESGQEAVTTVWLTWIVRCASLGSSRGAGFARGLLQWIFSCFAPIILMGVRWDIDNKVRNWGKKWGSSGMKHEHSK